MLAYASDTSRLLRLSELRYYRDAMLDAEASRQTAHIFLDAVAIHNRDDATDLETRDEMTDLALRRLAEVGSIQILKMTRQETSLSTLGALGPGSLL